MFGKKHHYKGKLHMTILDRKCRLFPVIREDILTLQEARQNSGWQITAFNLPEAWKLTKGEGVKIGILDTGCQLDHSDLKNNLLPGKNFINPKKEPLDDSKSSHGTHITGILVAENNDLGIVGVCPEAKAVPIKVLDKNGTGSMKNVADAVRWAVDVAEVDIISLSLGCPFPLASLRRAIQYAAKKGVPCFAAAGNAGETKEVFYPAAYPETISIGSINENFERSKFSNTGKKLDFMAPGDRILSTVSGNWYALLSGTSQAAPFAVGVCALALSVKKCCGLNIKLETVDDYRNALRAHTVPISNLEYAGESFFEGFGIIDPVKFVKYISENE